MALRRHRRAKKAPRKKNLGIRQKRAFAPASMRKMATASKGILPSAGFTNRIAKEKTSQLSWILAMRIADLERRQRIIWSWNVTGAIVLFFIIFSIEANSWLGWWKSPAGAQAQMLEYADLLAILILALDLAGRYRTTTNKLAFLRNNALEIIAIIPMGMILRIGQALESAVVLKEASVVARMEEGALAPVFGLARNTQIMAHFQKTSESMPKIAGVAKETVVEVHSAIASFSVVTDFAGKIAQSLGRALRIME